MAKDYLFIYGTLRSDSGCPAHRALIAPFCTLVDTASIQGRLYDIAGYPGLLPSGNPGERVRGEIYRFNDSRPLLSRLDDYEGCSPRFPPPRDYVRRKKTVNLDSGGRINAWLYVYNKRVNPLKRIRSGDFCNP